MTALNEQAIEEIVRQVLKEVTQERGTSGRVSQGPSSCKVSTPTGQEKQVCPTRDYPLAAKRPELINTATGKKFADITLEAVMKGEITPDDLRITAETLHLQAQIAEAVGRKQFAQNLRRAAELTRVPDERILEIYTALRPYRSTKEELLDIANELEQKYSAPLCAALVREAAEVYERRKRLKGME